MSTIKSSAEDLTLNADGSGNDIKFQSNGVEKASLSGTGVFTIASDNIVFGTAGKGIVLGSTSGNAANLLNDYKEGTWVPNAISASGSFGADPGNYGYYTKVGNLVFINGVIPNIPLGSASGAITITGLPFTSKTVSGSQTRHGFQLSSRQEYYTTEDNQPIFQVRSNSTTIDVINADGTWHSATEVSDLTNYWYPMFTGYYLV
jgi:enamine deaminase RidA (YjgF/YER057c/UK114 family)